MGTWLDIRDPRMDELATILAAHPRLDGYYTLRRVDITELRARLSEDRMLDAVFEQFAGQTWSPFEERVALGAWRDYAVTADVAQDEVVRALVGGGDIGHTRDTMSAALAARTWERFASMFAADRTYFTGLGLGDRRYAHQRGAAIVDATSAGFIGIVD